MGGAGGIGFLDRPDLGFTGIQLLVELSLRHGTFSFLFHPVVAPLQKPAQQAGHAAEQQHRQPPGPCVKLHSFHLAPHKKS